ncbi:MULTISPECIES: HAD family hydrolase [unclassified Fusibacter]|uniref:HAD family hydrolase n=1 Tax=unclassified Fusibacter TaxID=2624464 RepID=UPI0013E8FC4E|nr:MULTISPECIES: HAD family hydrolase [unclassified Fusibacter]MCK8060185.1 HAD family hydrolase [Fusibacter sp. A2]NPE22325.1 HAD family hydrolase [Fusibacter sp. A1]
MSNYKAVVFDLYGTLLDIRTDEEKDSLWRRLAYFYSAKGADYTQDEIEQDYKRFVKEEQTLIMDVEYPDIDILKVFQRLFVEKEIRVDMRTVKETATLFRMLSLDYVKPYEHAIDLLELLKKSSCKVILLSNAQRAFTEDELKATGIIGYFDSIYISSDYLASKPEPKFFKAMLDREGLDADDCLFIGNDHRTDIKGAVIQGMDSVYMHTNCSPDLVPEEIGCNYRVDSGKIQDVIEIIKANL